MSVAESHFDEAIWYNATKAGLRKAGLKQDFFESSLFSKHLLSRAHINDSYFNALLLFYNESLLEAYAQENSYSENSQKKTLGKTLVSRESPFLVKLQAV